MNGILKFERNFLGNKPIHINKRHGDTSYELHRHDYYEIIYYKNCNGICLLNGKEYPITKNCLFLLTPNDYHAIKTNNDNNASSVIISISETLIDDEVKKSLGFTAIVEYDISTEEEVYINDLCLSYFSTPTLNQNLITHLVNLIILKIIKHGEVSTKQTEYEHSAVGKAIALTLMNLSSTYSLKEISEAVNLTPSYFSAVFKKETGKTFSDWLSATRVEQAKRLLEKNSLSVLDICYECGYNTPSQFIKIFKRYTKKTPSAYRKATFKNN